MSKKEEWRFGNIKVTNFGKRHFDAKFGGTKITNTTIEDFEETIDEMINDYEDYSLEQTSDMLKVLPGYAPFCKLLSIKNFTNARVGSLPITLENYIYLRSGYSARTENELAVMSRWFELPLPAPVAKNLIVVIYSRAQLIKEHKATEAKKKRKLKSDYVPTPFEFEKDKSVKWGIVAILGQSHPNEEPMQPITMMRNALGVEEGGSGVPIDVDKYKASVEFWSQNAIVKS